MTADQGQSLSLLLTLPATVCLCVCEFYVVDVARRFVCVGVLVLQGTAQIGVHSAICGVDGCFPRHLSKIDFEFHSSLVFCV